MVQFVDLWRNHPINESVITPCIAPTDLKNLEGEAIRKNYPVFPHQCAVRMGVCLHRSGVTVEQLPGLATCNVHPREQMHFINASSFADVLARSNIPGVGKVERITGKDVAEYYPKLIGRTGLIYFRDYWYRSGDKPGQPDRGSYGFVERLSDHGQVLARMVFLARLLLELRGRQGDLVLAGGMSGGRSPATLLHVTSDLSREDEFRARSRGNGHALRDRNDLCSSGGAAGSSVRLRPTSPTSSSPG